MPEAELPRTPVKAQLTMRLPRTSTLPARKALMALPYWPVPPERACTFSMRLSITMRAVGADALTQDLDAVVADLVHRVLGDEKARRVEGHNARSRRCR